MAARTATALALLLFTAAFHFATPLDNGLGKRPGMGWNWDYCQGCSEPPGVVKGHGEKLVLHIARFLKSSGLQAKGYHYVNTDSFWGLENRTASGDLQPDPVLWPSGMESTVDTLHQMGLGFGLYGDRGTHECNGKRPGNLDYENQDAAFLARMKVDWFKQDSCFAKGTQSQAIAEYTKMSSALINATKAPGSRPIWFALCGWKPWYAPAGRAIANSWRTGPDTGSGWKAVMQNVANVLPLGKFAGATQNGGGWNDLSLLLLPEPPSATWPPGTNSATTMTHDRHRSQFSLVSEA